MFTEANSVQAVISVFYGNNSWISEKYDEHAPRRYPSRQIYTCAIIASRKNTPSAIIQITCPNIS